MHTHSVRSVFALLLLTGKNYLKYLLAVPAVVLQFFSLSIGALGIFILATTSDSALVHDALGWVLTALDLENFSYHGNPTSSFLAAYFVLGVAIDVIAWLLRTFFHVTWKWGFGKTLVLLILLPAGSYALIVLATALTGTVTWPPIIFLFGITVVATLFAMATGRLLDALYEKIASVRITTERPPYQR